MMPEPATPLYRFGDLLALARRSWVRRMESELEARGFREYRLSDAGSVRLLFVAPRTVGELGELLRVTRQAARKVATNLEARGYATVAPDPKDARKLNVTLTEAGRAYGRAIAEVIASLNWALALRVAPEQLQAADTVLRAVIDDEALRAPGLRRSPARNPPRCHRNLSRTVRSGVQARPLRGYLVVEHPEDLNLAQAGAWMAESHLHRLIEVGAFDDLKTSHLLLGLGEGPVGDQKLATPVAHGLGVGAELEPGSGDEPHSSGFGIAHPRRQGVRAGARHSAVFLWLLFPRLVETHQ